MQFAYCCCRRVAGRVRQGENPGRPSVNNHQYRRTTGRGEFISAAAHITQIYAFGCHQPVVANQHSLAVNLRLSSVAGNIAERSGDKLCYSGFFRATRDSLS